MQCMQNIYHITEQKFLVSATFACIQWSTICSSQQETKRKYIFFLRQKSKLIMNKMTKEYSFHRNVAGNNDKEKKTHWRKCCKLASYIPYEKWRSFENFYKEALSGIEEFKSFDITPAKRKTRKVSFASGYPNTLT